jgi:hypothetical protein
LKGLITFSNPQTFFAFVLLPNDYFLRSSFILRIARGDFEVSTLNDLYLDITSLFKQMWSQNQRDVFSFSYFKYWFPLLILINTLKSLLYYHCQVLTILTFSHHVHTTQIFSVKRMQHTAKQRLLFFSLRSQSKWIDNM